MTTQQAITRLHQHGARFILCRISEDPKEHKKPVGERNTLYSSRRVSVKQVLNHLNKGGYVGIEPKSLGYAVLDSDADGDINKELSRKLNDFMGGGLLSFPSLSNPTTQRVHLWDKINTSIEAPIGLKADGEPYKAAPTDMQWEKNPKYKFDIRFENSYVVCHQYFIELAQQVQSDAKPNAKWAEIIEVGISHRDKKQRAKIKAPSKTKNNPHYYKLENQKYLDTITEIPEKGDGQHVVANEIGYKVGQEFNYNPKFYEQAKKKLTVLGLDESRWESFEKAFEEGQRNKKTEYRIIITPTKKEIMLENAFKRIGVEFRKNLGLDSVEFHFKKKEWNNLEKIDSDALFHHARKVLRTVEEVAEGQFKIVNFAMKKYEFEDAIAFEASRNKYDPIKAFIDSIHEFKEEWGDPCWKLFSKFSVEENGLNNLASKLLWSPSYYYNSREEYHAIRPFVMLTGKQESGKSKVIEYMIPHEFRAALFGDQFNPTDEKKKQIEATKGKVIVECGEMQRYSVKDLSAYKAFSQNSASTGTRMAYDRYAKYIKRTANIVFTSDKDACLPQDDADEDMNTRFLPVKINSGFAVEEYLDTKDSEGFSNRQKIWAQVKHWVEKQIKEHGRIRIPDNLKKQWTERIKKHTYREAVLSDIVVEMTLRIDAESEAPHYGIKDFITHPYFVGEYLDGRKDFQRSRSLEMKMGTALRESGLWYKKDAKFEGKTQKRWFRTGERLERRNSDIEAF